jgi:hypothetical protein
MQCPLLSLHIDTCHTHTTSIAEGTTSVEPADRAEKATAARLKALESRADGEVGMTML